MIARLPPYPEYRASGVPWVGDVPAHWEVLRTRYLLREVDRRSEAGAETHLSMSQKLGLVPASMIGQGTLVSASYAGGKLCQRDDLVLNRLKAHLGVFALSRQAGVISPDYTVLRKTGPMAMPYFEYVLRSSACRVELRRRAKGIVEGFWRLYTDDLYDIRLPTPPLDEQAAIVHFLEHSDRRIRRYIAAKQKLIALLTEQKHAIVHSAVTRGLDPNVRLKPSGVEWLGDVPEHWCLKRFKSVVSITSGQVDPRAPEHRGKILLAPNHIKSGTGSIVFEETAEEQGADSGKFEVRKGQVVFSKIRPHLRKAAIARVDGLCSADMYPLTVKESDLRPEFLLLLLLSAPFTTFAVNCSLRVAMPKINREALDEGWLWFPDLTEQDVILRWAQKSTGPLDVAAEQAGRQIALMREYRARFIADVVTGRLDVRDAAARLPDEAVEPEPVDATDSPAEGEDEVDDADLDSAEA